MIAAIFLIAAIVAVLLFLSTEIGALVFRAVLWLISISAIVLIARIIIN